MARLAEKRPARPGPVRPGDAGRNAASARARRYVLALQPLIETIARETGRTAQGIASEMTRRDIGKPRGGTIWTPADVRRLLRRLGSDVAL